MEIAPSTPTGCLSQTNRPREQSPAQIEVGFEGSQSQVERFKVERSGLKKADSPYQRDRVFIWL
jgi:hypothetical protein